MSQHLSPVDVSTVSRQSMTDILFVVPPFASVRFPALGPSLLAASCRREGLRASVYYANLIFADRIGVELHERISFSSLGLMLGELLFRNSAHGDNFDLDFPAVVSNYLSKSGRRHIPTDWGDPITSTEAALAYDAVEPFIAQTLSDIGEISPAVAGLSIMFQQTNSAITIARGLQCNNPSIGLLAGGPAMAGQMGKEFARSCKAFDCVVAGECDLQIASIVRDVIAGQFSKATGTTFIAIDPIPDMDELPYPQFSDFFCSLAVTSEETKAFTAAHLSLPFESSRGCWWGQKNHCSFCGLNAEGMAFREKSSARLIDEISLLASECGCNKLQSVDNIMPRSFFGGTLEEIARSSAAYEIFYEVKANLSEPEIDQLFCSGVKTIQPGIESLSSDALKAIRKGVTGVQNIWLLRECLSRGINVIWNMLADIPGDKSEWYEAMLTIMPKIVHLQPPGGVSEIVIDRFSPYFDRPTEFAISNISPLDSYRHIFPTEFSHDHIAYHFRADYSSSWRAQPKLRNRFRMAIQNWVDLWRNSLQRPKLYRAAIGDGRYFVEDSRVASQVRRFALEADAAAALDQLSKPVLQDEARTIQCFESLLALDLVIVHEKFAMSVVVEPSKWANLQDRKNSEFGKGAAL
jgi:ribosomal peptide maturation radical SAM protein 1